MRTLFISRGLHGLTRIFSDLTGARWFQSQTARSGLEPVRRGRALLFESESLVLFQQSLAFSAQSFVFITNLHGSEVLLGREDKSACQYQSTKQQQRES